MSDNLPWKTWTPDDLAPPPAEFVPMAESEETIIEEVEPSLEQQLAQLQMQAHEQGYQAGIAEGRQQGHEQGGHGDPVGGQLGPCPVFHIPLVHQDAGHPALIEEAEKAEEHEEDKGVHLMEGAVGPKAHKPEESKNAQQAQPGIHLPGGLGLCQPPLAGDDGPDQQSPQIDHIQVEQEQRPQHGQILGQKFVGLKVHAGHQPPVVEHNGIPTGPRQQQHHDHAQDNGKFYAWFFHDTFLPTDEIYLSRDIFLS